MMRLFGLYGDGAHELVETLGLIASGITFDKWEPLLPLGIRDVAAITGRAPVEALAAYYAGECPDGCDPDAMDTALRCLQQAVAFFTWLKIIPTLDAQHDDTGRSRRLGENEKGLTALQEFKDERNILRLAYEAADALVETLERHAFPFWTGSERRRRLSGLLIRSKEEFDRYYVIGSHRLFFTLLPMMHEVQGSDVAPVLTRAFLEKIIGGDDWAPAEILRDSAARALALLTMRKAVERLPVEVLPEGVVQVNEAQPVRQRLRAEREARDAVAASLARDAQRALDILADDVARLIAEANGTEADIYVPGPIVHSKGMTF